MKVWPSSLNSKDFLLCRCQLYKFRILNEKLLNRFIKRLILYTLEVETGNNNPARSVKNLKLCFMLDVFQSLSQYCCPHIGKCLSCTYTTYCTRCTLYNITLMLAQTFFGIAECIKNRQIFQNAGATRTVQFLLQLHAYIKHRSGPEITKTGRNCMNVQLLSVHSSRSRLLRCFSPFLIRPQPRVGNG